MQVTKSTWIWIVAAAAALGGLAWAFAPRPIEVETAAAQQGRFEQAIEEDGRTRLKDRYTVSAPVAARLERISLREGDRVAAGAVVAQLSPVMSSMVDERSSHEASHRVNAAAAAVEAASARIARARIALQEAQLDRERTEKMAASGFIAPSRLDSARLAVDAARRELEMAAAQHRMAVQDEEQADAMLRPLAGVKGRTLIVRSPVAGVVLKVTQPSEATLPAGAALLDVGDPHRLEVLAELLTTDAVQAQPGRRVLIERWGGPPLEGRVRLVEPAAFTKVSALGIEEQRVNTLVEVTSPPQAWQTLGDGFRVVVRIITHSADQALLVPVGALFPQGEGFALYTVEGRRARLRTVELGGRNGKSAWVRSGLAPGQQVIVYPPSSVSDGSRVKVRAS